MSASLNARDGALTSKSNTDINNINVHGKHLLVVFTYPFLYSHVDLNLIRCEVRSEKYNLNTHLRISGGRPRRRKRGWQRVREGQCGKEYVAGSGARDGGSDGVWERCWEVERQREMEGAGPAVNSVGLRALREPCLASGCPVSTALPWNALPHNGESRAQGAGHFDSHIKVPPTSAEGQESAICRN